MRYLRDEGARQIVILNRSASRAEALAARVEAEVDVWEQLEARLAWADLVVSTTGAREPMVTAERFQNIHHQRTERTLFILDLAVPRDFDPAIGQFSNVYLYCIDDLKNACERNRLAREQEWPKAQQIVEEETARFVADVNHRVTGPTIQRLKQQADELKSDELRRLLNKLGDIDGRTREEIERSLSDSSTSCCIRPWNHCAMKPVGDLRTACSTRCDTSFKSPTETQEQTERRGAPAHSHSSSSSSSSSPSSTSSSSDSSSSSNSSSSSSHSSSSSQPSSRSSSSSSTSSHSSSSKSSSSSSSSSTRRPPPRPRPRRTPLRRRFRPLRNHLPRLRRRLPLSSSSSSSSSSKSSSNSSSS